ncbi:uncharacterized protein [Scyliorhinus torazame]|uniref:uncharacterized protein isoform X2 n=1 Tax=Scyliorhinus torazame TaxID=75743 RepID=UPI003B5B8D58
MEDLQKDRLHFTNKSGMSDNDLQAVYRNQRKLLISRVGTFLDNIEKKGTIVVEYFYRTFEGINKHAHDQLPSKQKGHVVDGPPAAPVPFSIPEASEVHVEKLKDDFVYLTNEGGINDVTLQQLVEALASQQVFNAVEKEKHLHRNEELHRRVTDFLMDLTRKGQRSCYLFYRALKDSNQALYTSLPSSATKYLKPFQHC